MGNGKKDIKKLINKYVSKKPLPTVEAMPVDATAVKQDPRKRKQIGNYKKVDSQFADAFRDILPVPDNVAQMLAKVVRGDARMSNKSLDDEQKVMLWDVIQNAKKRTGKADGGTEYEDYGGSQYGTSTQFNDWFNRGQYNVFEGAYNSLTNPGFKLASTIGRGKYFTDPENPDKVYYTDVYDWNAHEKNFPGSNIYQKVRNTLRAGEDPNLTPEKNDNYRMNFELDAEEIEKLRNKENGGWLEKYNDGGPVQENYNDASVSYPPNFVGEGTFNGPNFKNPAWGGQFQMGGSMPGAVGFTYARTINPAPSNGPYAKKTKASAQDGIDLSFISDPKLRNTLEGNKPALLQPGDYRLPEGRMAGSIYPSSEVSRSVGGEDGEPAYLIPSFKYGAPLQDYVGEYNRTGQYLGGPFKTWQEADAFGELRHQYIDKEYKTLPSPIKTWGDGFQNGGEMKYYQEGLDFKPKSISKNGSVIKDDMGQWAHPGEITEIGSNQITMQGVPYPVLGISDTGDTQMMYPNEDYTYEGSSVTEYPMMKEGGALQLTKLDQLTNFTNYNTKQPGGWLDKYQD